jgi:hypothetical protein
VLFQIKVLIGLMIVLYSCNEPQQAWPIFQSPKKISGKYQNGILIANEGNFGWGYGTISFYHKPTKAVEHEIFRSANDRILGNVVQSLYLKDTLLFIVVNNSKKIEIASSLSMKSLGRIEGLVSPRYFLIHGQQGYVTDLYSGFISSIDLETMTVNNQIETKSWTERMVTVGNSIFVEDRSGFILVLERDQIKAKITLNGFPNGLVFWENLLWTVCNDSLKSINPQNYQIETKIPLPKSPNRARIALSADQNLWILYGHVWKYDRKNLILFFEGHNKNLYALGAKNHILAIADAKDYLSASQIYLFENQVSYDTIEGGVITGEFEFNFF